MNILFIGPYRQADEFAKFSINYIKALSLTGHNIAIAPIYMGNTANLKLKDELLELENKKFEKYDIIIQNVLPIFFEKQEGYNIGIHYNETKNLKNSLFIDKMNLMDELWVCSESEKQTLIKAGVKCKINIVPIPIDIEELKTYENVEPTKIPALENKFVFYIMGDYIERKNLHAAIIAYNLEFTKENDVGFLIQSNIPNQTLDESIKKIQEDIINLKKKLRLYNNSSLYNNEVIVSSNLDLENRISLYKACNCLIIPSRAEAYSDIAFESLYVGNSIICNKDLHLSNLLNDFYGVESYEVPCIMNNPANPIFYTSWETWNEINILDLQNKMRETYNKGKENNIDEVIKKAKGKSWVVNNFSFEKISNKMKEILCQL